MYHTGIEILRHGGCCPLAVEAVALQTRSPRSLIYSDLLLCSGYRVTMFTYMHQHNTIYYLYNIPTLFLVQVRMVELH